MQCPNCEKANLARVIQDHAIKIGRFVVHGKLSQGVCPACDETLTSLEELHRLELSSAIVVLAEAKDINGPELKQIRKCIGLTQQQLGDLLGRKPETLSRQENDAQPMSRADQLAVLTIARGVGEAGGDVDKFIESESHRTNRRSLEARSMFPRLVLIEQASDVITALAPGENILVPNDFSGDLPADVVELDSLNTKTHRFVHRHSERELEVHAQLRAQVNRRIGLR